MANPEHLAILKQGVKAWNEWREKNPFVTPDLSRASLEETMLLEAELSGAILKWTNLTGANLVSADLVGADLTSANLSGANLLLANLGEANLNGAIFGLTTLEKTWLRNADLKETDLTEAFTNHTSFDNTDLSEAKGLDKIFHLGPSTIGIDTIYRSKGNIPDVFLRGCGVPEDMIAYARSLRGKAFEFYSCFISHSAKDKHFCERLYAGLQAKGVRVWYFPENAKWGETVWGEIDRSIKKYDKLIVVCSENSLQSGPVNREIERALIREDKEGKGILFPIRIDDYVFNTWEHERKADVLRKVVGDFSDWDKDAAKYDKAFDKLLKGLQAK